MINKEWVSRIAIILLAIFYFLISVKGTQLGVFINWIGGTPFVNWLHVYRDFIVSGLLGLAIYRWITFRYCLVFSFVSFLLFYFKIIPRIVL